MTEQDQVWATERNGGFRPVQYLGSKFRLLEDIVRTVDEVAPGDGPAIDLFSGSGVVAARLARSRPVIAVDIQEYARVLAAALLRPAKLDHVPLTQAAAHAVHEAEWVRPLLAVERDAARALDIGDPEGLCAVIERGAPVIHAAGEGPDDGPLAGALAAADVPASATLTKYYGGVYFAYAQTLRLDALLAVVRQLPEGQERDTALAAVLGTASDCVSSVGNHFAQPVRPRDASGRVKRGLLRAALRRRRLDPFEIFAHRLQQYSAQEASPHESRALCGDFRDHVTDDVAVVYADPPYTRDHYSRFYHVLETMARGDDPEVAKVTSAGTTSLSRGIYRRDRHQSPFCIRSKVRNAFTTLFRSTRERDVPLVLSYSPSTNGTAARPHTRLLPVDAIVALAQEHFTEVVVRTIRGVAHSKFNAIRVNAAQDPDAEVLVICTP